MTSIDSRPRILIAIDWYLPAFRAGGPIRSIANLIAALGDEFKFHIVCGNRDLGSAADLDVPTNQWVTVGRAEVYYLPPDRWTASTWAKLLRDLQPDRLYLNSLYSGPFSRLPWKVARSMGIPTTLAPRGMLGEGALRIKPLRKRLWLMAQKVLGNYDDVIWHASTEQEAEEIRRWFPRAEILTALNLPVPFDPLPTPTSDGPDLTVLSVGRVHPIKNYLHGVHVANALAEQGRSVCYRIVGPIEDRNEAARLKQAAQGIQLVFTGPVAPPEVKHHFASAHLVLVPSLNENFGHAVAEAIAHGRPALVSDQTVWSTMRPGQTVSCLPLEVSLWVQKATAHMDMDGNTVLEQSRNTYARCLLNEDHLEAQRIIFSP